MGWLSESKQFGQLISKLEYLHLSFTRLFLIAVNQVLHDIVSACSNVMHVNIMQFMLIKIRNIMFNATFNNIMSWRQFYWRKPEYPEKTTELPMTIITNHCPGSIYSQTCPCGHLY